MVASTVQRIYTFSALGTGAGVCVHGAEGKHQSGCERPDHHSVPVVRRRHSTTQLPPANGERRFTGTEQNIQTLQFYFSARPICLKLCSQHGGLKFFFFSILGQVIFITTLFYLLAMSGDSYKPVEWFVSLSPAGSSTGSKFGQAVEEAIGFVTYFPLQNL